MSDQEKEVLQKELKELEFDRYRYGVVGFREWRLPKNIKEVSRFSTITSPVDNFLSRIPIIGTLINIAAWIVVGATLSAAIGKPIGWAIGAVAGVACHIWKSHASRSYDETVLKQQQVMEKLKALDEGKTGNVSAQEPPVTAPAFNASNHGTGKNRTERT